MSDAVIVCIWFAIALLGVGGGLAGIATTKRRLSSGVPAKAQAREESPVPVS